MTSLSWSHGRNFILKNVTSTKLYALRSTNCLLLKYTIKYLANNESIGLMWFKIYGHFFFYKIYENYDVILQKVLTPLQK